MPKQILKPPWLNVCQLSDGDHTGIGQLRLGDGSHAPHQLDRQVVQENELGCWVHNHQPVRLGDLRGDLGEVLGARHADGDRKSQLPPDLPAYLRCNLDRPTEQAFAPGDVGKRLINRETFDERRKVPQHLDRCIAQALVFLEVSADELQLRAQLTGAAPRHAAAHSERLGLIGGGEHDAAAHGNRFAA